ncbi:MAG: phosphate ABC transporter substrate-binding protein [Candidatus Hydrogenedentes bacterium]|nr:phosphate ABC transporter substrate-binding protein [Candidatus Hydrogenedentota bacterium]
MYRILIATILCLAVAVSSCGPAGTREGSSAAPTMVTIKGSDTMVHLVTAWAEDYMAAQPSADISVTGGGSGTGIAALLNGNTDICAASREMTPEEKQLAAQKNLAIKEVTVARDGIAVVVNPANPISELTLAQLKDIYTGAVTNWSQVGGSAGDILLLSRESSSGTFVFFQEHVLQKADFAPGARLMPATSTIIQAVEADAFAIGYVGLGYAREAAAKVKVLAIKADQNAPAVMLSEETVRSGAYSISRPLYFYVGEPVSQAAQSFIDFCLGPQGQKIVQEIGYVQVS